MWNIWKAVHSFVKTPEVKAPETRIQVVGSMDSGQGSCLIVRENGLTIALDCGASPFNGNGLSYGQATEKVVREVVSSRPQFIVISHYHHDHWGALPRVFEEFRRIGLPLPTIVSTDLTFDLLQRHFNGGFFSSWLHRISHKRETDRIKLIGNKHSVPGSASVLFHGKRNIFYTGDLYQLSSDSLPKADLLIVDSTGAMKEEPRPDKEAEIRKNIVELTMETLQKDAQANVYIALFSTQLERASYLQQKIKALTGFPPMIKGTSLFQNLSTFNRAASVGCYWSRVALCTGIWAQGENSWSGEGASALVRISNGNDRYCQFKKGDVVILSGSMPTWSPRLFSQIKDMCERIYERGARIVCDASLPKQEGSFVERAEVHLGGHGNMPEIAQVIETLRPKQVLPFHASPEARERVAKYCRGRGMSVISANQSSIITL